MKILIGVFVMGLLIIGFLPAKNKQQPPVEVKNKKSDTVLRTAFHQDN